MKTSLSHAGLHRPVAENRTLKGRTVRMTRDVSEGDSEEHTREVREDGGTPLS